MLVLILTTLHAMTFSGDPDCQFDAAAYVELDPHSFDQTEDGWRGIARQGCYAEAAEAIAIWRANNEDALGSYNGRSTIYWHEGQMRAHAMDYNAAISLFEQSRDINLEMGNSESNIYMTDATIAFLQQDFDGLIAAREGLLSLETPPGFEQGVKRFRRDYPDLPLPTWPSNLHIFDRLITCFDYSYEVAYSGSCPEARQNMTDTQ